MPTRVLRPHQRHGYGPLALALLLGAVAWASLVIYAFRSGGQERSQTCLVVYAYIQRHGTTADMTLLRQLPCQVSTAERKGS